MNWLVFAIIALAFFYLFRRLRRAATSSDPSACCGCEHSCGCCQSSDTNRIGDIRNSR